MTNEVYTYRAGKKVLLEKQPDQFVVRALPEDLRAIGITDAEQVSSSSSRVTTRAADLEPVMSRADLEAVDVGKLNRWTLKIMREPS